jgi:hypothetical protein
MISERGWGGKGGGERKGLSGGHIFLSIFSASSLCRYAMQTRGFGLGIFCKIRI